KGPFSLYGVDIDTEWRSDWKWDRVLPHLSDLTGRTILDVGCGNHSRSLAPWPVSEAMADIVTSALRIGAKTDGAMDITVGPLVN
ncbi:DUF1698 domain-containing protein, partial [Salmonella enterica subsp. enterica serovar Montevideo]|nr:DUF1698 domain-containing protein [Salmonella enterica subsp. enterica serovar Montevideo]